MSVFEIVFSPTGGTRKVSGLVAGALDNNTVTVDLTDSGLDLSAVSMTEDDVAVISVPAYAGRVPAMAVDRLNMVHGNGARAVLVCVYGNRAFEDTLVELEDVAKHAGFRVIAAVAAIAEHSIARQFAAGRPDAQDAAQLAEFAQQIQQKLLAEDAIRREKKPMVACPFINIAQPKSSECIHRDAPVQRLWLGPRPRDSVTFRISFYANYCRQAQSRNNHYDRRTVFFLR